MGDVLSQRRTNRLLLRKLLGYVAITGYVQPFGGFWLHVNVYIVPLASRDGLCAAWNEALGAQA